MKQQVQLFFQIVLSVSVSRGTFGFVVSWKTSFARASVCSLLPINNNDDDDKDATAAATIARATSTAPKRATTATGGNDSNIHLLSLRWTNSSPDDPRQFSKIVRDLWRWKDAVLGDGRDFFVPKPRTLRALQSFLRQNSCPEFEECVVLSNCARFEILVVVSGEKQNNNTENGEDIGDHENLATKVSSMLMGQVDSFSKRPFKVNLPFDNPQAIDVNAPVDRSPYGLHDFERLTELSEHWTHSRGAYNVAKHLCLVAAGMAPRPNRPDRAVVFQPFSSRDAHVLLQLKRTLEVASGQRIISTLLRSALSAGKAARNVDKVPELDQLRQYGSGNSKYSSRPPQHLSQEVAKAALGKAIEPVAEECANKLAAADRASSIREFRQKAESMARGREELSYVRRRLHDPTMQLRSSGDGGAGWLDTRAFLNDLKRDLNSKRREE